MAKTCQVCNHTIKSDQLFVNCSACCEPIHKTCLGSEDLAQTLFKCHICQTKDNLRNNSTTSDNSRSKLITKMDEVIARIGAVQEEQKVIINSVINTCNNTIDEYKQSIKCLTELLSNFESKLDNFNEELELPNTPGNQSVEISEEEEKSLNKK